MVSEFNLLSHQIIGNIMHYKILFIDEESGQQDKFMDYFESAYPEAVACCEFPLSAMDDMLEKIWTIQPDAIVTDFRLNEIKEDIKYTVKYNGMELVKAIRRQRENFPCFVITSFADEAVNDSDDVNLVYEKWQKTTSDNAKVTFAVRVIQQIEKYRSRIDNAKRELSRLIDKRLSGRADVQDEEQIIEIDTFLEKALGAESLVPPELKRLSNLKRLDELIEKVDEILSKVQ